MQKHTAPHALLLLLATAVISHAARIPPSWLNAVVAIGHKEASPQGPVWVTEASGFFYGYLVRDDPDPAKRGYEVYLITNRHVIANHAEVDLRLNPKKTSDQGEIFNVPMTDPGDAPAGMVHP